MNLRDLLENAARGAWPPVDGRVDVLPRPAGVVAAVVAFTGHHIVAADIEPAWVHARIAPWEIRFDVDERRMGAGLGRMLAAAAPALVPAGEPVFAQVAPGNVASLRTLLAAGYRPLGGEVLFFGPRCES